MKKEYTDSLCSAEPRCVFLLLHPIVGTNQWTKTWMFLDIICNLSNTLKPFSSDSIYGILHYDEKISVPAGSNPSESTVNYEQSRTAKFSQSV